ncbi:hypothetical protein CRUP_030984 [Coryphaenoides rupestris]|nr:hypothetical protein CRUP_030984 [Coryphaenoides rupestris]
MTSPPGGELQGALEEEGRAGGWRWCLVECEGKRWPWGTCPGPWYLSRACFSQNISSPAQKWPRILRLRPHSVQV